MLASRTAVHDLLIVGGDLVVRQPAENNIVLPLCKIVAVQLPA